jgi:transcriptional regulator GlxA family with amidase domain
MGVDMESVRKVLWFMEGRFGGEVSLDELSVAAGISRCHFAHVFARATGQSAMRYMRGRRLSEAARVLANSGPDILTEIGPTDWILTLTHRSGLRRIASRFSREN